MNDIHQNGKTHNFEKTYPGCLGRMVNLFELNLGASTNRLLTDKPHLDGSPLSRSRSDVSRMSPSSDHVGEKVIVPEFKNNSSNRKLDGMPMKMLIAQEMSKDVDCRRSAPNLVAKLMGLDSLPRQEPDSAMPTSHCRGHPRSHSDIPLSSWEQQNGFFHCVEPTEYKDVYEIWQKSQRSPYKGRYDDTNNNNKMALVREKFVEAKRLSMDGKLRQSKQFQDALEVLNSNKDLFSKCLQEPHSMFSQHLYDMQSIPPPETKRITVLRPSKMVDSSKSAEAGNKDGQQMKRSAFIPVNESEQRNLGSSPYSTWKNYENHTQPTRIVVLKPSPGKPHDVKPMGSPHAESPRILSGEDFLRDVEDEENQESREVAKAITQQMREKLGRHRRDETLVSSVFSNGYVGDESSFNKSEIDYEAGNLSDSEVISPVSRHSWDYVHRLGSPYSSSSFSRASYSPESSVGREAKKRLSERWAMMASNGGPQEQRHFRRSSSTLGEMLALSEINEAVPGEGISSEESKDSNTPLISEKRTDEINDNSPMNLIRSKSLPVSSTEFGSRLNVGIPVLDKGKSAKEETKARNGKSLFKGRVSNLFFSRNKKPTKDKSIASESDDEFAAFPGEDSNHRPNSFSNSGTNHMPRSLMEPSSKASFSNFLGKQGMTSHETGLATSGPIAQGNLGENQDQPSPISVLNPPFEEDKHAAKLLSHYVKPDQQGVELPLNSIKSSLIDKSPPIGSIARTLSWDDSCVDTVPSRPVKESLTTQGAEEDEQQEWFFFVKTLLTAAGLQGEVRSNSFLSGWHSAESPLDPSLRDKYVDYKDKETLHEAKRRQKRSIQKLVFDCVNLALLEISGYGSDVGQRSVPYIGPNVSILGNARPSMLDEVWARMSILFSGEARCDWRDEDEYGDENGLVVESLVRNEVAGKGWIGHLRLEMDNLGMKIEGELLEELVHETVAELSSTIGTSFSLQLLLFLL